MANRYFIELAYDGTPFHGWQIQPNAKSIQESLNNTLSTILRSEIYAIGCGRTDTGVHAKLFYAHFDSEHPISDLDQLKYKCNRLLDPTIAVFRIFKVNENAHARFSAISRSYDYLITQQKDPFAVNRKWEMREKLNLDAMNEAAAALLQYEDFTSFSKSNTQTETNLCAVSEAKWTQNGMELQFKITANRFLRNMVRAIVGTTLEVGQGKINVDDFRSIIEAKNRSEAGLSVPAHGLYLSNIVYPEGMIE
jgi:tRNA pseudouridine38-40 synthase